MERMKRIKMTKIFISSLQKPFPLPGLRLGSVWAPSGLRLAKTVSFTWAPCWAPCWARRPALPAGSWAGGSPAGRRPMQSHHHGRDAAGLAETSSGRLPSAVCERPRPVPCSSGAFFGFVCLGPAYGPPSNPARFLPRAVFALIFPTGALHLQVPAGLG